MVKSPHRVAALIYDGLCTFEFGIAVELFGLPRPEFDFPWYDFIVVPGEQGALRAAGGIAVGANPTGNVTLAQTVIVPGWRSPSEVPPLAMVNMVRDAYERGARIVSICGGVFVLAEAGILDGRRAATHWMFIDELQRRYPKVRVDPSALYIDEGAVLTSAGSSAGIDLCLHMIRCDHGAEVTNRVARRLIAQPYREGDQTQFIETPVSSRLVGRFANIFSWMEENIHQNITLARLAEQACMSERSFQRHFKQASGVSPTEWILRERVRRSQRLLESTNLLADSVARDAGFNSVETFRYHFRRLAGISPSSYRKAFTGNSRGRSLPQLAGGTKTEAAPQAGHAGPSGTLPPPPGVSRT
jgi:AraC family transcriptional activator FtrA